MALGAAIGKGTEFNNSLAIGWFGIRQPTSSLLFDTIELIIEDFFFFKISVRGPGQKRSANLLATSFISKSSLIFCKL